MSKRPSLMYVVLGWVLLSPGMAKGQEPGYLLWMFLPGAPSASGIYYAPTTGTWLTQLVPSASGRMAPMAPLPGNRHYLVNDAVSFQFHLFDRDSGSYGMLPFTFPPITPGGWSFAESMLVDQEGDLIVLPVWRTSPYGLYRLGRDARWSIVAPMHAAGSSGPGPSPVLVDLDSGDYVVSYGGAIRRVRPWGVASTIAPVSTQATDQDPETGEFLVWGPTVFGNALYRMTGNGTFTDTGIRWLGGSPYAPWQTVVDDGATAAGEYVMFGNTTGTPVGSIVGRASRAGGTVSTLLRVSRDCTSLFIDRDRNLTTTAAGARNSWQVFIDFPYDPGSPYVCLVGASSYRPGVQLPDNRKIRLNPDLVTARALAGGLPGVSGLAGVLDSRGTAQGMIDLSNAGPAAQGVPFWLVGLVLDPAAPSGIRRISRPIVVQIR